MTQYIQVGQTVVGVRQTSSVAMAAVAPEVTTGAPPAAYAAQPVVFANGLYQYAYPADPTIVTLSAAGLFDLGTEYTFAIRAIRGHCGGGKIMNLSIAERGGALPTVIWTSKDANNHEETFDGHGLIVLPSQVVLVSTDAAGTVDLYVVRY
jgi:hypothetical protein